MFRYGSDGKFTTDMATPLGIYVHIPFCQKKCHYCDFYTVGFTISQNDPVSRYFKALHREISYTASIIDSAKYVVDTIYFGGGTPTTVPAQYLVDTVSCIRNTFTVSPGCEITTEANPGSVDPIQLEALCQNGFNRISLGVQSFDDRLLRLLGRLHTSSDARSAVTLARSTGIENISIDLIFGLPTQSFDLFKRDIECTIKVNPTHVSAYSLILERGTQLESQVRTRRLPPPNDDLTARMMESVIAWLTASGFNHYEISNFARHGAVSRHNLKYWRMHPYLGVGVSAASFIPRCTAMPTGYRWTNARRFKAYVESLLGASASPTMSHLFGQPIPWPITDLDPMPPVKTLKDAMILGIRCMDGVHHTEIKALCGIDPSVYFADTLSQLAERHLIVTTPHSTRLTKRGILLGNYVFEAFV